MKSTVNAALLATLLSIPGCGAPDPCEGYFGSCVAVHASGALPPGATALEVDIRGAVARTLHKPLAGMSLPVTFALELPASASGALTVALTASGSGDVAAVGRGAASFTSRQHARVDIELQLRTPDCNDSFRDGSESDVDCGGTCSAACADGLRCTTGGDCARGICNRGRCGGLTMDWAVQPLITPGNCIALAGPPAIGRFTGDVTDVVGICPLDNVTSNLLRFAGSHSGVLATDTTALAGAPALSDLIAVDWDLDKVLDLVAVEPPRQNRPRLHVYRGVGDGTFLPSTSCDAPEAQSAVVGDWNGDGRPDAAVLGADLAGRLVHVFLGDNQGGCTALGSYDIDSGLGRGLTGDLNGDGKLDLLVDVNNAVRGHQVTALLGDGKGKFAVVPAFAPAVLPRAASAPVLADLTGDGRLDLALPYPDRQAVLVLPGSGDGSFDRAHPIVSPAVGTISDLTTADFDLDGHADLALLDPALGRITILAGSGNGIFASPVSRPVTLMANASRVVPADMNDDGLPDLVVTDPAGLIGVLLNASR